MNADFSTGTPTATLVVDNVVRTLIDAIRTLDTPPTVQVDLVSISDPTTVQHGPFLFQWARASYNELQVEIDLTLDDFMADAFPGFRFDKENTPGAF